MFERGRVYPRAELHNEWGGATELQRQGGILTPREVPLIVVVTGEEGRPFGYDDHWDDDGVFHYYGAGQVGDMEFVRGNKALRDHAVSGEDVHLFEQEPGGVRYVGQVACGGFYYKDDVPDANGDPRRAIVFELIAFDEAGEMPPPRAPMGQDRRWTIPLDQLRVRLTATVGDLPDAREAKRRTYVRSDELRIYVRRRADGTCDGCEQQAPFITRKGHPYLEPHHTRRLSDGGPDDYHHVIALCPTCHRRVHHGDDGDDYNELLKKRLRQFEAD
jgi:5-methylcytosine-specific restriction enzyme A